MYESRDVVFLDGYRSVDLKRFRLPDVVATPEHAIELLLRDGHYRDDYLGPDSHKWDAGGIHGPYRLAAISTAAFEPLTAAEASGVLRDFAALYGGASPEAEARLEARVLPVFDATSSHWRLRDLGPGAGHELSMILDLFHEIVAVDLTRRRMVLVVAFED